MLESILRNLLSNAIKFSECQGKIEIFSMPVNEFVEITVADNGVGMDENVKANLFKSDLNESKPGTANEKGTGLGLIICKDFVERNHGKIWIENNREKGTAFKFTLPIYKEEIHNSKNMEFEKAKK